MNRLIGLAVALAALSARGDAHDEAVKAHRGEAKRHIWTGDVALEQARLGMRGLYALVDDSEGAFDRQQASILIEGVKRDVRLAASQLQKLTALPADKNEAPTDLTRAQASLARVQTELKSIEGPAKAGADKPLPNRDGVEVLKKELKGAWKTLDEAAGDFKKVADDYKVTTRLPTP